MSKGSSDILKASEIIKRGGVVAFPTETVYGLGANALNPIAVAKIFALKERPSFDPLIVHICSFDQISLVAEEISPLVKELTDKFWPGPLTIVLPKKSIVPDIVTSGLPTVGVRMPDNSIALELIKECGTPLAAPSANKFGNLSPVKASHVKKQLPDVDFVLDGGKTKGGIESTIVSVKGNICTLLRPGLITLEDIERVMPQKFIFANDKPEEIIAPGLLKSHYSPSKPLYITDLSKIVFPENSGVIIHSKREDLNVKKIICTSADCTLTEVAANLFSAMHTMEEDDDISQIYIESVVEKGLGIAIMDRVKKAAYRYTMSC